MLVVDSSIPKNPIACGGNLMEKRYMYMFLFILVLFVTPACTGGGAPDAGDYDDVINEGVDNDEGNNGDIDQIDNAEPEVEANDETTIDTAEEPVEESDDEPEINLQELLAPFRWIEGDWYCEVGDLSDQGVTMNVRITGWDDTQNAVKIIGFQPCINFGYSQKIENILTFFGAPNAELKELWCDNGVFDLETKTLTFDGRGHFYVYVKVE
jgi:hypothetical protein